MKLSKVLSVHQTYKKDESLSEVLGHDFLMKNNLVYRNIILQALDLGSRFESATPEYLLMPFHQLEKIVSTKTIPYIPSAGLLQGVESKRANVLSTDDLSVPESYHLHEAAHVIADEFFKKDGLSDQEQILKALICESFANTVDALSWISVEDDMHHFFLWQNCYMHPEESDIESMRLTLDHFGLKFLFAFTMISYLHANFLKEGLEKEVIENLAQSFAPDAELNEDWIKELMSLRAMAEKIDPQFRVMTTKMYFSLEGYDRDFFEILDFSFMDMLSSNPAFKNVIKDMASFFKAS